MRSSKSRSRGNKNRNTNRPTGGNIINRVFDSSGPDGKVRGTPQQIIEKYNQLHRDAQLSNDRVNAENFAQHAEHYLRMLAEAQREVDRQREEQEEQNRARQAERDRERNEQEELNRQRQADRDRERNERLRAQEEASGGQTADQPRQNDQPRQTDQPRQNDQPRNADQPRQNDQPRHSDQPRPQTDAPQTPVEASDSDSTLVDTPESRGDAPAPKPRKTRAPRKPRAKPDAAPAQPAPDASE
ncbi:DUF4167 domain-containing protein [Loktanella sp. M215]|uniref:DUF4167 domain-containing protein n=1 Tax=Loktanella sp. M215 TaxID=2675431 RepID=UPI001F38CEC1|nr:DUF4167 domain-containing protein [Loktanella sp. M215]MCF7700689.1 DUF4167 domain-containing protein [Loktanella sp. M215]